MKWGSLPEGECTFTTPLPSEAVLSKLESYQSPILDVGCGYGRTLRFLKEKGFTNLTGIDISPELVKQAKANCAKAKILVADFQHLESLELCNRNELILLMGVLEYLLSDEEQNKFFRALSTLLAPNGNVFLETFLMDWKQNWVQYMQGFVCTGHLGRFRNSKDIDCHHQSERTLLSILRNYFTIICATRKKFTTWSGVKCNGMTALLGKKNP